MEGRRGWHAVFPKKSQFCRRRCQHCKEERSVIFCDPGPLLLLKNSVQVQPQSEKFFKCKIQVQMKSKKFEKCILFTTKMPHFVSINSVQIRSRPKILMWFTVRIQPKLKKICYSPDPVQSKSSPMLISAAEQRWIDDLDVKQNFWPQQNFWAIVVCQLFCFSE